MIGDGKLTDKFVREAAGQNIDPDYVEMVRGVSKDLLGKDETFRPISSVKIGFETGLTIDERYLINKFNIEQAQELDMGYKTHIDGLFYPDL
jgi:hypothetical protein